MDQIKIDLYNRLLLAMASAAMAFVKNPAHHALAADILDVTNVIVTSIEDEVDQTATTLPTK